MFRREVENAHFGLCQELGLGYIAFSPLAQGLLTNKYLHGIPADSRVAKAVGFLKEKDITPKLINTIEELNKLALERGQTLAEMALAWVLRNKIVTSVIIGTSSVAQIDDNLKALDNIRFSEDELKLIESVLSRKDL